MSTTATALDPSDLRAFVAIQTLGLCAALEAGALSPADAGRWLFRPEMHDKLEAAGACEGCLGLVDLGAAAADGESAVDQAVAELRRGALAMLAMINAEH